MNLTIILGPYSWLLIPFGLFLGLLGYRLYKISLFVIGLFLGLALGSWIGQAVDNVQLGLILGIVLGLAFGVTAHLLIRFGLFVAGMAGGVALASVAIPYTSIEPGSTISLLWGLGAALAGGLLTLALYKILILVITALLGSFLIFLGTSPLFPVEAQKWTWILYAILFIVFVLVQAGWRKGHEDPIEREKKKRRR